MTTREALAVLLMLTGLVAVIAAAVAAGGLALLALGGVLCLAAGGALGWMPVPDEGDA